MIAINLAKKACVLLLFKSESDKIVIKSMKESRKVDIKELLSKMTLKEKLYQLQQINSNLFLDDKNMPVTGPEHEQGFDLAYLHDVSSVYNSYGAERNIKIQSEYLKKSKNKIPLAFMLDVIHGYRTIYPINLGLSCSFDMALCEECASMAAREASVDGIHLTFSPMLDVSRDARWGRVMESSGEDTYLTCEIAKATVKGFWGENGGKYKIGAGAKHIAGYSAPESGKDYNLADMSEHTLREYYLPPYKSAIDAGAMIVMPTQGTLNGIPGLANKRLMVDILREEWGFDGVVISDYGAIANLTAHGYCEDKRHCAEVAIDAQTDMEMVSTSYIEHLEALVDIGKISMEQIDRAVLRVLELKRRLGLFENPYGSASVEESRKLLACEAHREIARRSACESAVLLKNEGVLPFSKDVKTVAVIGPLANEKRIVGSWWCAYDKNDTVTVYEGVKRLLGDAEVVYAQGCELALDSTDISKIDEAVELARRADVVILCLGEDQDDSGESNSKAFLELPCVQKTLLERVCEVNKNTALALFCGRPLALSDINDKVGAILNMFFPGTEGGNALASLMFADSIPCGKLTMSFPRSVGQCPIYYNHYKTGNYRVNDTQRTLYASAYIDSPNSPLYPFGYGLSYTSFEYSNHKISAPKMTQGESIFASVTVKNTGKHKGKETVQLYIQDIVGSVVRPIKELRGFEKITLDIGEQRDVTFEITADTLSFVGADLKRKAEKGKFNIFIGSDSTCTPFATIELV